MVKILTSDLKEMIAKKTEESSINKISNKIKSIFDLFAKVNMLFNDPVYIPLALNSKENDVFNPALLKIDKGNIDIDYFDKNFFSENSVSSISFPSDLQIEYYKKVFPSIFNIFYGFSENLKYGFSENLKNGNVLHLGDLDITSSIFKNKENTLINIDAPPSLFSDIEEVKRIFFEGFLFSISKFSDEKNSHPFIKSRIKESKLVDELIKSFDKEIKSGSVYQRKSYISFFAVKEKSLKNPYDIIDSAFKKLKETYLNNILNLMKIDRSNIKFFNSYKKNMEELFDDLDLSECHLPYRMDVEKNYHSVRKNIESKIGDQSDIYFEYVPFLFGKTDLELEELVKENFFKKVDNIDYLFYRDDLERIVRFYILEKIGLPKNFENEQKLIDVLQEFKLSKASKNSVKIGM